VIAAQEFDCFVCQALDGETGDFVAIKRIRVDRIKNKQLMKLLAEGHLMEQLDHENIVKFHGALEVCSFFLLLFLLCLNPVLLNQTDNHISLIMEFVDSGSLASVVSKYGNLSEKLAAVYLKQVLDGLAYLHRNNVVHRDVRVVFSFFFWFLLLVLKFSFPDQGFVLLWLFLFAG
jgi:serine/threonine protein kinase